MAANVTDLTSKLWSEIRCLQNDLLEGIDFLKQRRKTVESHCLRCQQLFKPWPQSVCQTYKSNEDDAKRLEIEQAIPQQDCEDEKEKQELAVLDDILAKAQQAREIHKKLSKSTKKSNLSVKPSNTSVTQVSQRVPSTAGKESRPKAKVTYPIVTRPPTAKTTYADSYKNVSKTKKFTSGTKRPTSSTSSLQAHPKMTSEAKMTTRGKTIPQVQQPPSKSPSGAMTTAGKLQNNPKSSNLVEEKPPSSSFPGTPSKDLCNTGDNESGSITSRSLDLRNSSTERKFLLSEQGSSLTMPSDFYKRCRNHKRLLRRVQEIDQSQLEEQNFAKRVEESFCPQLAIACGKVVYETSDRLAEEYKSLVDLANSTMLVLRSLSETTTFETIFKAVVMWESIISKCQLLDKELHSLFEELDQLGSHCPCSGYEPRFLDDLGCTELKQQKSSLTSSVANIALKTNFCSPTSKDGFFSYQNLSEFRMLQQLSHDFEIKRFQLELRRTVGRKILPLLKEVPTNHRLFIPLFRSIYSILCCDSRTFPTMVKDTFPDDASTP